MDINDLRSIITVVSVIMFVGIVMWAYSGRRKQAYDEAANLPFAFDDGPTAGNSQSLRNEERKA